MRITINLVSYEQPAYEVQQGTTIAEVKKKFEDEHGIPMENFEFYFNGQLLQRDKTLGFYNIPDGAILEIQGRLISSLHPRYVGSTRMLELLSKLASLQDEPAQSHPGRV